MSHKTIVLCIDVDDTLINHNNGTLTFNGSVSLWSGFLSMLRNDCESAGYKLIIQIISAKKSGNIDSTIHFLMKHLQPCLPARTCSGTRYDSDPKYYNVMFHVQGRHIKKKIHLGRIYDYIDNYSSMVSDPILLPAIHICYCNNQGFTSKAKVMKQISEHFSVPPENMFLLDNDERNRRDIDSGAYGRFSFVSAHDLGRLRDPAHTEQRNLACQTILSQLRALIKTHLVTMTDREAVQGCLQQLVEEVVAANQDYEKQFSVKDSTTNINAFFHRSTREESIKQVNLYDASPFICSEQRKEEVITRLAAIGFDDYLVFFQNKAKRKAAHVSKGAKPHVQQIADAAERCYQGLLHAKINFFKSQESLAIAQQVFIEDCEAIIGEADKCLLKNTKTWWLNVEGNHASYAKNRNSLMRALEGLKNEGNIVPIVLNLTLSH